MQAYSPDLRERVAAACAVPSSRRQEVAARFSVSVSFVDKLLRRQRQHGSVAALAHRGGPPPALGPQALTQVAACLQQQPDATLDELRIWLAAVGGPAVGRTCVWKAVETLGWTRKKAYTPLSATPSGSWRCAPPSSSRSRAWMPRACGSWMKPVVNSPTRAATPAPLTGSALGELPPG